MVGGHGFSFATDWWPGVRADQPTAFWSYLYTLFLAAIYVIFGHHPLAARLIQAVLVGLAMPWLTYRLAGRVFSGQGTGDRDQEERDDRNRGFSRFLALPSRPAKASIPGSMDIRPGPVVGGSGSEVLAAAISAIYAYFVLYAASLMTEAFYITAILWILDAALRLAEGFDEGADARRRLRLGIELGLAMGTALLLRQVISAFLVVLASWFLALAWRRGWLRQAIPPLLASALTLTLLIAPFVVRNYRLFGVIGMPNTNVGINFFWDNHPIYGTQYEAVLSPEHGVSYQELIPPELRGLNDALLDRALLARGVQIVVDDPVRYLLLCLSRIPIYFQFWPTPQSTFLSNAARLLSFGVFLPFMLYGIWLVVKARVKAEVKAEACLPSTLASTSALTLILAFIVIYTAVHLLSWANVRYRLPVDAVLLIFAGLALARIGQMVTHRQ